MLTLYGGLMSDKKLQMNFLFCTFCIEFARVARITQWSQWIGDESSGSDFGRLTHLDILRLLNAKNIELLNLYCCVK